MQFYSDEKLVRSHGRILIIVCLLHVSVYFVWPIIGGRTPARLAEKTAGELFFLSASPPPLQQPERKSESKQSQPPVRLLTPSVPVVTSPAPISVSTENPAANQVTNQVPTQSGLPGFPEVQQANPDTQVGATAPTRINRDLGRIIREVQREFPNRTIPGQEKPDKSSMLTFAKNVEAAARARGTEIKTFTLSDGTSVTKVTTPAGTYCVIAGQTTAANFGKDPGTRTVSCGNY